MDINTGTIQRLRDALVAGGRLAHQDSAVAPEDDSTRTHAALQRFYPYAETLYLMMMIDEHADDAELDAIRGAMRILTNGSLSDGMLDDIFQRCAQRASQRGVENCLQEIGAQLATDRLDRETAFTLAAAMALADDQLHGSESALMLSIAEWFGISGKRAAALLADAQG